MSDFIDRLRTLSAFERRNVLESAVVQEFKLVMLMPEEEEFPVGDSYFDLGLTSLGLNDVKQRLEDLLDRAVDSTQLFNSPTVERLVDYLTDDLLAAVWA
jgi:acyl carrier protein